MLVLGRRGAWGEAMVKSGEIGKTGKTGETGYFLVETIVFIRFRAPDLQNPLFPKEIQCFGNLSEEKVVEKMLKPYKIKVSLISQPLFLQISYQFIVFP